MEWNGLGLLLGLESFLHGKSVSYHFLHLSVQELLAAKHISTLSVESQVSAFRELFKKQRLVYVFRLYAAFTKLKAQGIMEIVEKEIESKVSGRKGDDVSCTFLIAFTKLGSWECITVQVCSISAQHLQRIRSWQYPSQSIGLPVCGLLPAFHVC